MPTCAYQQTVGACIGCCLSLLHTRLAHGVQLTDNSQGMCGAPYASDNISRHIES